MDLYRECHFFECDRTKCANRYFSNSIFYVVCILLLVSDGHVSSVVLGF